MSGTIIERRDQVLMTFLVPRPFCTSTFLARWSSTNGPFFRLRGISSVPSSTLDSALLAGLAATNDQTRARLVLVPGAALGLAPRRHRMASTGGLALTTTVRVVDRVHGHTAYGRALALPAVAAGLAPVDVRLFGVADPADRGAAADVDHPHLARRHPQGGVAALAGHQLDARPCGTAQLGATARTQLHRMHGRTDGDVAQRQVVARLD